MITTLDELCTIISDTTGIAADKIKGKSRDSEIVQARHFFRYFACEHFNYTQKEVANFLGKERSAISKNIRRIKDLILTDKQTKEKYNKIKRVVSPPVGLSYSVELNKNIEDYNELKSSI